MCQPPFANTNLLRGFFDTIVSRSREAADCLHQAAQSSGKPGGLLLDVSVQTQRLTLDVVGLTAFSHDFRQVRACLVPPYRNICKGSPSTCTGDCYLLDLNMLFFGVTYTKKHPNTSG